MLAPASRRLIAPGSRKLRTVASRAVALWHARAYDEKLDALLDLSGNGLHARLGSAVGADTNDPLRLQFSREKYVYFPGSTGNYGSMADAAWIPRDDFTIEVDVAANDWSTSTAYLLSFAGAAGNFSWGFGVSNNSNNPAVRALGSVDGTNTGGGNSTDLPFVDGGRYLVRLVRTKATGVFAFFYSLNNGESWVAAGTQTTFVNQSFFDSTGELQIGASNGGNLCHCRMYRCRIWSDTTQTTKVFDVNAAELAEPYASVVDAHGNTITLNRSSSGRKLAVVDRDMFLLGTDDYFEVADHPLLNFGASDSFTLVGLVRPYGSQAGDFRDIFYKSAGGATPHWTLELRTDNKILAHIGDGTNSGDDTSANSIAGALSLVANVVNRKTQRMVGAINGVYESTPVDISSVGSLANTSTLRIGRDASVFTDMEFIGGGIFREVLTAEELMRLRGELLT